MQTSVVRICTRLKAIQPREIILWKLVRPHFGISLSLFSPHLLLSGDLGLRIKPSLKRMNTIFSSSLFGLKALLFGIPTLLFGILKLSLCLVALTCVFLPQCQLPLVFLPS